MTDWDKIVRSNLKGAIAESLFEDLLRASCRVLCKRGFVWSRERKDREMRHNRRPDFKIKNLIGEWELVEVKFRAGGFFHSTDEERLEALRQKWLPKIVLFSYTSPCIQVVLPKYDLDSNRRPLHAYPIEQESVWGISLQRVDRCTRQLLSFREALP